MTENLTCPKCGGPAEVTIRGTFTRIRKGLCSNRCGGKGVAPNTFSLNTKPASTTPEGTCQCCFRNDLKVKTPGDALDQPGKVSLHGYERPGEGYIVGKCWGESELPYEQSCEVTKKFLQHVKDAIAKMQARLADLQADRVETLNHQVWKSVRGMRTFDIIEVKNGAAAVGIRYSLGYIPSFEELRQEAIGKTQRDLSMAEQRRDFLQEKVDTWTLRPLRPSTSTYEANAEKQRVAREAREKGKAEKEAKKEAARQKRIQSAAVNKRFVEVHLHEENEENYVSTGYEAATDRSDKSQGFLSVLVEVEPGTSLFVGALRHWNPDRIGSPSFTLHFDPEALQ